MAENRLDAIPQRTIIGKVKPDAPDTMYPNEHFQEFFPAVVLPEELPESYRSCALRLGASSIDTEITKIEEELIKVRKKQESLEDELLKLQKAKQEIETSRSWMPSGKAARACAS